MRPFRFRVWSLKQELPPLDNPSIKWREVPAMTYFYLPDLHPYGRLHLRLDCSPPRAIRGDRCDARVDLADPDCIVMQSTGLVDLKGREIFEGDVVQRSLRATTRIGVVEWHEDSFWVTRVHGPDDWYTQAAEGADFSWGELIVLGDKFQNPELLESSE